MAAVLSVTVPTVNPARVAALCVLASETFVPMMLTVNGYHANLRPVPNAVKSVLSLWSYAFERTWSGTRSGTNNAHASDPPTINL